MMKILLSLLILVPSVARAALNNPIAYNDIYSFLTALLELATYIAFPVIILFIVYVGFLFVAAQGKPEAIQKAQKYFFWAIVGALIVLGAQALAYAIEATVQEL
ncbi:MAG: hypothetical protein RLZZ283_473 [Candidatus Parcubacteria bacterium]|jgi:Na+-driven multidrug efflux pump